MKNCMIEEIWGILYGELSSLRREFFCAFLEMVLALMKNAALGYGQKADSWDLPVKFPNTGERLASTWFFTAIVVFPWIYPKDFGCLKNICYNKRMVRFTIMTE